MGKIRAGYVAVRADIEPAGELAVLTFKRADGKTIPISLTASQVTMLITALTNLLAAEPEEVSDNVTT